jgi:hypothetical protein
MRKVRDDLATIRVDNSYEVASMLLLGEQDVDDMVAGTDEQIEELEEHFGTYQRYYWNYILEYERRAGGAVD